MHAMKHANMLVSRIGCVNYPVGESLVIQLQEVLEYVVVRREDGLAERLGYSQVLPRDHPDEFEMAHQPHLVVFARVELRRESDCNLAIAQFWENTVCHASYVCRC